MAEIQDKKFDLKLSEFINILNENDEYYPKRNDQDGPLFSMGKHIGTFFYDYKEQIIDALFNSEKYKGKVSFFKARAKIIEYFKNNVSELNKIKPGTRNPIDTVLDYYKSNKGVEDTFISVSINMANDGRLKRDDATSHYRHYVKYTDELPYDKDDYKNNAAERYASSSEKFLKALIMFDELPQDDKAKYVPKDASDFRTWARNPQDKLMFGSLSWRKEIDSNSEYPIKDEKEVLGLVQRNLMLPTLDTRVQLDESDLLTTSGHNLYSLYAVLDPITKIIVNSEFYIYDTESIDNERKPAGMIAVLKENKLSYDKAGVSKNLNQMKSASDAFVKSRYADINLRSVKPDELEFLRRINTALEATCSYEFPNRKVYDSIDFDSVDEKRIDKYNLPFLKRLKKYYLLKYFNDEEIERLMKFIGIDDNRESQIGYNYIDNRRFINLAIFFKTYIVEKLHMNLPFEMVVLDNLKRYYDGIAELDLFNGVSDSLFLNEFFTKENIERLQQEINELKTMQQKLEIENSKDLNKKENKKYTMDEIYSILKLFHSYKDDKDAIKNYNKKDVKFLWNLLNENTLLRNSIVHNVDLTIPKDILKDIHKFQKPLDKDELDKQIYEIRSGNKRVYFTMDGEDNIKIVKINESKGTFPDYDITDRYKTDLIKDRIDDSKGSDKIINVNYFDIYNKLYTITSGDREIIVPKATMRRLMQIKDPDEFEKEFDYIYRMQNNDKKL